MNTNTFIKIIIEKNCRQNQNILLIVNLNLLIVDSYSMKSMQLQSISLPPSNLLGVVKPVLSSAGQSTSWNSFQQYSLFVICNYFPVKY